MNNYYRGTKENPYHLSVGAVILNNENKICCHYFKELNLHGHYFTNLYILMRETLEMGESIEDALHRGLREEFGITGEILTYLGSIKGNLPKENMIFEKTTLYFLVKMKTFEPQLRSKEDEENGSRIEWHDVDFLIPKMKEQAGRLNNTMDESSILERIKI